ncbi:hypothetical protein BB561_005833 [Smittium simulii]|uniref:Uncharacterized protein n=1 Tax=Smittium simulii TaxID=133385 RepID=A0A2T9Y842_9FUNG|nr:hypothetical protein BB561_005833 [Smittium simulii]
MYVHQANRLVTADLDTNPPNEEILQSIVKIEAFIRASNLNSAVRYVVKHEGQVIENNDEIYPENIKRNSP